MLAIILCCMLQSTMFAWGKEGRHLVVEIAKGLLDKKVTDVVENYIGTINWSEASDYIEATATPRNAEMRKQWQKVLVPRDQTYVPTKSPNLLNQIDFQLMVLSKRSMFPAKDVAEALKLLFALVPDAHQPLRCGYPDDQGGNNVNVTYAGKTASLLKLWDDDIIKLRKCDAWSLSKVLMSLPQQERMQVQTAGHMIWFTESRALLKDVYTIKGGVIDDDYLNRAKPLVEKQLVKAALRLAALLKRYFNE
jgi:hypothetical protein